MCSFRRLDIFYFLLLLCLLPSLTNAIKVKIDGKINVNDDIADIMVKVLRMFNIDNGFFEATEETLKKQQEEQNLQNKITAERNMKLIDLMTKSEEIGIKSKVKDKGKKHKKRHSKKGKKKSKKHSNHIVV